MAFLLSLYEMYGNTVCASVGRTSASARARDGVSVVFIRDVWQYSVRIGRSDLGLGARAMAFLLSLYEMYGNTV
jgi:hypothetical protein